MQHSIKNPADVSKKAGKLCTHWSKTASWWLSKNKQKRAAFQLFSTLNTVS